MIFVLGARTLLTASARGPLPKKITSGLEAGLFLVVIGPEFLVIFDL